MTIKKLGTAHQKTIKNTGALLKKTKEMYVCCTDKGTHPMVECTAENFTFMSAVVKSQIQAGGVAPKRKYVDKDEREELGIPGVTTLYKARMYRCKIQRKDGVIKTHVESWDKGGKGEAKERIIALQNSQLGEPAANSDQPANEADEASGTDESCDGN